MTPRKLRGSTYPLNDRVTHHRYTGSSTSDDGLAVKSFDDVTVWGSLRQTVLSELIEDSILAGRQTRTRLIVRYQVPLNINDEMTIRGRRYAVKGFAEYGRREEFWLIRLDDIHAYPIDS